MYTNFEDLDKAYGIYDGTRTRDDFTEEELKSFVNDCFDTYEHIGFAETFATPYAATKDFIGQKFIVLGRVKELTEDKNGADRECLPMWKIRFEDGVEIDAYPEEICLAERDTKYDKIEEIEME